MQSIIIPLVKSKTGDLADPNNYRAIAISTAMSKIVETVLAPEIKSDTLFDDVFFLEFRTLRIRTLGNEANIIIYYLVPCRLSTDPKIRDLV